MFHGPLEEERAKWALERRRAEVRENIARIMAEARVQAVKAIADAEAAATRKKEILLVIDLQLRWNVNNSWIVLV